MRIPASGGSAERPQGLTSISQQIWRERFRSASDASVEDTWRRVAAAVAAAEASPFMRRRWAQVFYDAMTGFKFLPGGRTLAGAGAAAGAILFDCLITAPVPADAGSILANLHGAASTLRRGGRAALDFSAIPPKGHAITDSGARPSGPLAIMDIWRAIAANIVETDVSSIAALSCAHPDIEDFIADPRGGGLDDVKRFVLIPDAFMAAVEGDDAWPLVFGEETFRTVGARALWRAMLQGAYEGTGLGLLFVERASASLRAKSSHQDGLAANDNALRHEASLLGSINLAALVEDAFTPAARIPEHRLDALTAVAVRFLDNVIDVSGYALPEQKAAAKSRRKLRLGVTGLADALILCGAHYGAENGRRLAERWMARICRSAYLASAGLARLKGCFPRFDRDEQLGRSFVAGLDADVANAIRRHGLRNGALMAMAPAVATSLLADNVSAGIEPVFDFAGSGGSSDEAPVLSYAERRFRGLRGGEALPGFFVTSRDIAPQARLHMQAAVQRHIDAPLSSVINCPPGLSFEDFEQLCRGAHAIGASGCAFFGLGGLDGLCCLAGSSARC